MHPTPHQPDPTAADEWPTAQDRAQSVAEATRLLPQAEASGLRVELYLPPQMASWLLAAVMRQDYLDPQEAVFVLLQEAQELTRYPELRRELLRRTIGDSVDDPTPPVPIEEVFARLKAKMAAPRPEPAIWNPKR
jgi:antitoxin ParD1/3/4